MVFPTLSFEAAFGVLPGQAPDQHLSLDGASGTYASTPDAAALDITSDIDLRVVVSTDDWAPGTANGSVVLIGKLASGGQSSYSLRLTETGALRLTLSDNGSAAFSEPSTELLDFAVFERVGLRATWRASDGRVQYFTSDDDGATWTQLGSDLTVSIASIHAGTATLIIGGHAGGLSVDFFTGRVYSAEVRDGIGGTIVASPDFTAAGDGWVVGDDSGTTAVNDGQANPWSLIGTAEIVNDWTDLTSRLRVQPGITWSYGRQNELDHMEAGTGTVYLDNLDRALDSTNTASVYYPFVRPMTRVRLRATHSSTTYDVFEGFVEAWPQSWPGMVDAVVPVSIVDGFILLSLARTSAAYTQDLSGTRIGDLLDAAGWPTAKRDLDAGQSEVQAYSASDRIVLNAIRDTVEAESGVFFIAADGDATFRDRHSRVLAASVATFGDDGVELRYRELVPRYDDDQLWNDIAVKPDGLTVQRAEDDSSQKQYGTRSLPEFGALVTTESEALNAALWTLRRYKDARQRVERLTIAGHISSDLLTQALARGIGDRLTVRRRPPGGGTVSETEVFIEKVTHNVGPKRWTTTWQLSPAFSENVWLLGTAGFSELNETTYVSY